MRRKMSVSAILGCCVLACAATGCHPTTPAEAMDYTRQRIQAIQTSQPAGSPLVHAQSRLAAQLRKIPGVQGVEVALQSSPANDNGRETTIVDFHTILTVVATPEPDEKQIADAFTAAASAAGLRVSHFWKLYSRGHEWSVSGWFWDDFTTQPVALVPGGGRSSMLAQRSRS